MSSTRAVSLRRMRVCGDSATFTTPVAVVMVTSPFATALILPVMRWPWGPCWAAAAPASPNATMTLTRDEVRMMSPS